MTQKISKYPRKKAFKRKFDLRRIKRDMSYSPQEICELLGSHKNTVHMWLKGGLRRIDKERPYLIHGSDLYAFLEARQKKKHRSCALNEMYCVKCHKPQLAWENVVDVIIYNAKQLMLRGLCAFCQNTINKLGSVSQMSNYQKLFIVQTIVQRHIIDTPQPSAICDKKRDT